MLQNGSRSKDILYILYNFQMETIVIERLMPRNLTSSVKMCKDMA